MQTLAQHMDVITYVILGLFAYGSFWTVRALKKIDQNQQRLFEKLDVHETRLSQLEGAHNAVMASGKHGVVK